MNEVFVTNLLDLIIEKKTPCEESSVKNAVAEWLKGKGYFVAEDILALKEIVLNTLDELEKQWAEVRGPYLPLSECKHGYVYRITSRNLSLGVFNSKNNGFIGIREKFDDRFLFTEFHYDTGPPFGTVRPVEEICRLPDDIAVSEGTGIIDSKTGKSVFYDSIPDENGNGTTFAKDEEGKLIPIDDNNYKMFKTRGWCWSETGLPDKSIRATNVQNKKLFEYLETVEKRY